MLMAIVIMLTYYPMAIIISPITTNIDRSLTIKYKTEFSVIFIQLKILLSLITELNRNTLLRQFVLTQATAALVISLLLMFFFWQMTPCLILSFGKFEFQLILFALTANAAAYSFLVTPFYVGYIITGALLLLHLAGYYLYRRFSAPSAQVDDFEVIYREKLGRQELAIARLAGSSQAPQLAPGRPEHSYIEENEEYLYR